MGNVSLTEFINKIGADKQLFESFISAVRGGDNKLSHNVVSQSVSLDDSWILTIESALYSIEQIVRNPRKFIIENELIVDVAKARRTNSKTVRHLSSHSQFIQNIDKNGEVMPKKLLTAELEEDLAIYENRFICALVNRLVIFVEQRHRDLEGKLDVSEQTNVKMHSEFNYGGSRFKCALDLQVQEPPQNVDQVKKNQDLYDRVDVIRRRLRVLQATEFVKTLSAKKPVRPPIQKTNLLNKNVDYNNCYKLWLFISSYTYLGYSVEVMEKELPVESDYYDDLTLITGLGLQSLVNDNIISGEKYRAIEFNPPIEKDYEIVSSFSFNPSFDNSRLQAGSESINEYYFRKMKEEVIKISQDENVYIEKQLNLNFTKFFRAIGRINDEMFTDIIEQKLAPAEEEADMSAVQKKRLEIRRQQERLKRRKLLTKLKWEELERAQRVEERANAKIDKLEKELRELKEAEKLKLKKAALKVKPKGNKVKYVGKKEKD